MKSTRQLYLLSLLAALVAQAIGQIELPPQVRDQTLFYKCMVNTGILVSTTFAAEADAVSDGLGHHYVIQNASGQIQHYLFDNLGSNVDQVAFGLATSTHPSITSRNGKLHVALRNAGNIELWESVNGGSAWIFLGFRPITGSFSAIDSYEDNRGIHITYTTSTGTYYRLYGPGGWNDVLSAVVRSDAGTGILPAIVATAESVHVFSSQSPGLRSFKFPTDGGSGQWQNSTAPITSPLLPAAVEVLQRAGETNPEERYLFAFYKPSSGNTPFSRAYRKYIGADVWHIDNGLVGGFGQDTRAKGVVATAFPYGNPVNNQFNLQWPVFVFDADVIEYYRPAPTGSGGGIQGAPVNSHNSAPACSPPEEPGGYPTIGYSLGSLAFFWRDDNGTLYFRRKPWGIKGDMNENYVLTDTNWIIGPTVVKSGKNLTLKSGSVTVMMGEYSMGPAGIKYPSLTFESNATITMETGSRLIIEGPGAGRTVGGIVDLGNNVAMTVPSGATLELRAGAKMSADERTGCTPSFLQETMWSALLQTRVATN